MAICFVKSLTVSHLSNSYLTQGLVNRRVFFCARIESLFVDFRPCRILQQDGTVLFFAVKLYDFEGKYMKTYTFTSIKGGVLKITNTSNIALGLAQTGRCFGVIIS
jgi:hypothetical protein